MDRRAALKKLGAGGAIAAGGSIVLSSTNVAYAASNIGPVPSGATATYSLPSSQKNLFITLNAPAPSCSGGTSVPSYQWGGPTAPGLSLRIESGQGRETVDVRHTTNSPKFRSGDVISISVTVTWTCGIETAVANYTVTVPVGGTATVSGG